MKRSVRIPFFFLLFPFLASAYDYEGIKAALDRPFMPAGADVAAWSSTYLRLDALDKAADDAWGALKSKADYEVFRKGLREKLLAAMGDWPERCPLNAKTTRTASGEGWKAECVTFETIPGVHVTGNFFLPDDPKYAAPYPCVVITCGHTVNGKGGAAYNRMPAMLAKAGLAAFIYDPMEQGERRHDPYCWHDIVGIRGILLGIHSTLIRTWDGMRAIDYVQSRPEVDGGKIGYCGQSGGGTMTSLLMAADPRIKAAAPSCYLISLRELCEHIGPQDLEQNVYGQLAFGLNHAGYVLTADAAVLQCGTYDDFFTITGFLESRRVVARTVQSLGTSDRYSAFAVPGPHGWRDAARTATVDWMRYWLRGETDALPLDEFNLRTLDLAFDFKTFEGLDTGLVTPTNDVGCWAAPGGNVANIPGNRDLFDVLRDRLASLEKGRKPLTDADRAKTVREVARIHGPKPFKGVKVGVEERIGDLTVERWAIMFEDGSALPGVLFVPDEPKGPPAIVVASEGRASAIDWVLHPLYGGASSPTLAVDLSAWGENGTTRKARTEECIAIMEYLMGETLVGRRADEILTCVDFMRERFGGTEPATLIAMGRAAIPAVHAKTADPSRIGPTMLRDASKSWREMVSIVDGAPKMGDVVPNALKFYDWPDLAR